jgi:hypothetical protein
MIPSNFTGVFQSFTDKTHIYNFINIIKTSTLRLQLKPITLIRDLMNVLEEQACKGAKSSVVLWVCPVRTPFPASSKQQHCPQETQKSQGSRSRKRDYNPKKLLRDTHTSFEVTITSTCARKDCDLPKEAAKNDVANLESSKLLQSVCGISYKDRRKESDECAVHRSNAGLMTALTQENEIIRLLCSAASARWTLSCLQQRREQSALPRVCRRLADSSISTGRQHLFLQIPHGGPNRTLQNQQHEHDNTVLHRLLLPAGELTVKDCQWFRLLTLGADKIIDLHSNHTNLLRTMSKLALLLFLFRFLYFCHSII